MITKIEAAERQLNTQLADGLGALAIYLHSEKRWFKIPIQKTGASS
jgi:hypothetical protein